MVLCRMSYKKWIFTTAMMQNVHGKNGQWTILRMSLWQSTTQTWDSHSQCLNFNQTKNCTLLVLSWTRKLAVKYYWRTEKGTDVWHIGHFTIYVSKMYRYSWRPILFENSHFGNEMEISSSNSVGTSLFYEFAVTFRWIGWDFRYVD